MAVEAIATAGDVLNSLADKIFEGVQGVIESKRLATIDTIQAGKDAGISLQVEAGRQVRLAIEKCKNAYKDSLNTTLDKVTPELQNTIATMKQLVEDFFENREETLLQMTSRIETMVVRLPFAKTAPALYSAHPSFIAYMQTTNDVLLHFFGPFTTDQSLEGKLTVGANWFPVTPSPGKLTCKVPYPIFCAHLNPSALSLVELKLDISWKDSDNNWEPRKTFSYTIWIGVVPSTPGKLFVEYLKPMPVGIEEEVKAGPFYQSAGADGGGHTIIDREYAVAPKEGWSIKRGTHHFDVMHKSPSRVSWSFVRDDQDQVVYKVTTKHHNTAGESGRVRFNIKFTQFKEAQKTQAVIEEIDLEWGESRVIEKEHFKKMIFHAFDGKKYEMSGANSSNPYAKVTSEGGQLVFRVVPPESIKFLPTAIGG